MIADRQGNFSLAVWLFLKALGICYFFAFLSAFLQAPGLLGDDGILPVRATLGHFFQQQQWLALVAKPTLLWLDPSSWMLLAISGAGLAASVLIILGLANKPALAAAWVLYLSIVNAGGPFFSYTMDELLLEAGFLAIFLRPWCLVEPPLSVSAYNYSPVALWLLRWEFFRVFFCSGVVKLESGCQSWRDLTALTHYYETQLSPNLLSWYAHQLPSWFHITAAAFTFVLELLVPFCLFAPPAIRRAGAIVLIILQLLMAATGNHGTLNYVTIALTLTLFDDSFLNAILPDRLTSRFLPGVAAAPSWQRLPPVKATIVLFVLATILQALCVLGGRWMVPYAVTNFLDAARPYHLVNGYALYPYVFTKRSEIVIEGSNDGTVWKPYEFSYHVGAIDRPPGTVVMLAPRLDWLMRAAAAVPPERCLWLHNFLSRLLEGSPSVLSLLRSNPFPDHPPRFIRVDAYDYSFTDPNVVRASGSWWQRTNKRTYLTPLEKPPY